MKKKTRMMQSKLMMQLNKKEEKQPRNVNMFKMNWYIFHEHKPLQKKKLLRKIKKRNDF